MLWPGGIRGNKGQIEAGLSRGRQLALSALGGFLQTLESEPVFPQIDSGVLHELVSHPIHDAFVKILAAEKSVARSRKNFEHTLAHLENRDVECSATQIVNSDFFRFGFTQAIRQSSRGRLVNDAMDLKSRDFAG